MAFSLALGVTPESLKEKATEVSHDIEGMAKDLNLLYGEVMSTSGYWKGDAGDLQRRQFEGYMGDINRLMERLRTYPTRILTMAGLYEQAEELNERIASSTKTDIQMR